jgi:hypothetical protein
MEKKERDVLLYTTSHKKKIFIFFIYSFIKKDLKFFEKVFLRFFFKKSQKYESILPLLIFLETMSKLSIFRELVNLIKFVFTKRLLFRCSCLYNFILNKYENRRNGLGSKFFNKKINYYNFYFLTYNQKIKNRLTGSKINSNCSFLLVYFKIFKKLSSFFLKKSNKFLVKTSLCNSKFNFSFLKLKTLNFIVDSSLEKKYFELKLNKNLKKGKITQKKSKVWPLNFYYWLFIEVQHLIETNLKYTKNNQLNCENYPLILSAINFSRKINNKFFLQENLENFLDEFFKCIIYPDIMFYKLYKNNLENTDWKHSSNFQLKIFSKNMKKNSLKSFTTFYFIKLFKSNKMRLVCKHFMSFLC